MNPIRPVILDDHSVFWELAPGKPNPHETCTPGRDKRSRVVQSAQKGGFCWYYAMNMLRVRVGKQPSEALKEERGFEKAISDLRKAILKDAQTLPFSIWYLHTPEVQKLLMPITQERAKFLLSNRDFNTLCLSEGSDHPALERFIDEFTKSKFETIHAFLIHKAYTQRESIFFEFFQTRKVDLKIHPSNLTPFHKLTIDQKESLYEVIMRQEAVKAYGLKPASWMPHDSFNQFFRELKASGPILVSGLYGSCNYLEPPFKVEVLEDGTEVLGWKKSARDERKMVSGHSIVVVGAKKVKDKGYIYFVDPNDPSDPKNKSSRPVYVISYENLRTHAYNLDGCPQPVLGPFALQGKFSKERNEAPVCKVKTDTGGSVFYSFDGLSKELSHLNGASSLSWNPSQSAELLANQLLASGPSLVRGALGPKAYLDAPIEVIDDFAQEKVWAWKVGAKRAENASAVYDVYLIGVKILKDKAQVFLLDAADLGSRKIYKISFENLQKHISADSRKLDL